MAFATRVSLLLLVTLAFTASAEDVESALSNIKEVSTTITNEVNYMPPTFVFGKRNGDIKRCLYTDPSKCETFDSAQYDQSAVTASLVHGEYLFAGQESGNMLRCIWQRTRSCQMFHQAGSEITGLAVLEGYIYVGLKKGEILRCNMNMPGSCKTIADTGRNITALIASGPFLYTGSGSERIDRCDTSGNCSLFCTASSLYRYGYNVTGLAVIGQSIYGLTFRGDINFGDLTLTSGICNSWYTLTNMGYKGMAVYKNQFYAMRTSKKLYRNTPGQTASSLYSYHDDAVSISFAYGTYAMQEKYRVEVSECIWTSDPNCPPPVFYYDDIKHRSALEVVIKDGKLYHSQGVVVDTSSADSSHSQRAAIFAMGPDGQILLSKKHKPGQLHTSSLFAGNPVSGAGLMVVKQGKIVNITACSVHYRPDQELNDQVKDVLRMKGYTDSIDFHPCSYSDMLCVYDGASKKLE